MLLELIFCFSICKTLIEKNCVNYNQERYKIIFFEYAIMFLVPHALFGDQWVFLNRMTRQSKKEKG